MQSNDVAAVTAQHDAWFQMASPDAWDAYQKQMPNGTKAYQYSLDAWFAKTTLDASGPDYVPASYAEFDGLSAEALVKEFGRLKLLKEKSEEEIKTINTMYDFLRFTKIPRVFEDREILNLKVAGVGRCQLTDDAHVGIVTGQKEIAFQYLRDTARGDLIEENVNNKTLKTAIKKALKDGEVLPEGVFKVAPYARASIVKV